MKEQLANEILEQINIWKRERDQLDDLIDDAYRRVDELMENGQVA